MDTVRLSDEIIFTAIEQKIEDIYFLPSEEGFLLLYRKGAQRELQRVLTDKQGQQLIARFKYLGQMDVAEKRKAQLGAITYNYLENALIRLRLSTVGDYRKRESLVIRILHHLNDRNMHYFFPEELPLLELQTQQRGLFLFSGPVGSGKTTLMYHLAKNTTKQVITIEDPVEIEEPEFLQLQVNTQIGQDYNQLIKLSLRHRPDLLIIGEIRDEKTAQAVIRAALTGHRVFATIHARSLDGTAARFNELVSMKRELATCLRGVVYQQIQPLASGQLATRWAYRFYADDGKIIEKKWMNPSQKKRG
ncbi:MAG: competence type IV pilus ATPase ComGA [Enterococcus sp.]